MKTINYNGEEAVLVKEFECHGYLNLTFLQKTQAGGINVISMFYDDIFGTLQVKDLFITPWDMDAIDSFRNNRIDSEEFAERIQLAM